MTFVGAGMICSHLVNLSLLLGAVLSFGVMFPLIDRLKGHWFPDNLEESNMKGIYGYKVFLSIALILGDGIYNFIKILVATIVSVIDRMKSSKSKNHKNGKSSHGLALSFLLFNISRIKYDISYVEVVFLLQL